MEHEISCDWPLDPLEATRPEIPTRACKTKVPVCQVAFWLNGRGIGLGLWERVDALAYVQGLLRERHVAGGGAQAPTAACATGLARAQALEWLVKALFDEACAGALVFVVLASQALGIVPGNVVTLEAHGDVQDRNPLPDVPSCTLHAATFLNLSATSALLPGTAAREIIVMAMAHKVANRHFPRRALDLALRKRGKLPGGPLKPIKPINRVPTQVTCEFPSQLKINRPPSASQLFFVLCVLCFWSSRLPHALLALQEQAFGSGRRIGTNLPCSGRTFFQFGIQDSLSKQAVKQHQKQDLLSASSETFGHCTPPGQEALTSLSVHSNPSFCPEEALLWASHTLGHWQDTARRKLGPLLRTCSALQCRSVSLRSETTGQPRRCWKCTPGVDQIASSKRSCSARSVGCVGSPRGCVFFGTSWPGQRICKAQVTSATTGKMPKARNMSCNMAIRVPKYGKL